MESYSFWRDLLERIIRNLLQTALPIAAGVAATGKGLDLGMTSLALATVVVYTLIKGLLNVIPPEGASLGVQILDRVGSAVAATFIAFVPEGTLASWADWAHVDWKAVGLAALGSAATALVQFYLAPPALGKDSVMLAA
ncbi:MAG TPA: hypothetical protein VIV60_06055 [Polyangiaceae bacterium]